MRAQGVLDPTGEQILQFEDREPLEEGLELVTVVPSAEYEEWLGRQELPPTDPEDTEPNVPEGVEETDILTRAELTERVRMLEEELAKAMALLYPEGKEEDREP